MLFWTSNRRHRTPITLPCIVSLPGITTTLKTGDLVEMDGAAGTVSILES
ncbi:MAG: hypothetical protein ABIS50_14995 [Luteolibacter sp.]